MYCEELKNGKVRFGMSYTDARGKSRKVSVTMPRNTTTYRREAEHILNEKVRKAQLGMNADQLTLGELADLYEKQNGDYVVEVTHIRNVSAVRSIVKMVGADINVSRINAKIVSTALCASGRQNSTLNGFLRRFKTFWRWAYRNDYVPDVTWLQKLKYLPEEISFDEKNEFKYLERDELQTLLPQLYVRINRYVIAFLALSGLRIGETLALTKEDVDMEHRLIRVRKTYNEQVKKVAKRAKTYDSNRNVYMQDELYELCAEIFEYYRRMKELNGTESNLFFCDLDGNRLKYARLNKYFAENTERVIGRRLTLHSLRHTNASLLFEQKVSLEAVAARLGHKDSEITKKIYLHITKRLQDEYNKEVEKVRIL